MEFRRKIEICCEETISIRHVLKDNNWYIYNGTDIDKFLFLNIWDKEVMPTAVQHGLLLTHEQTEAVILLAAQNIDACEEFILGIKRDWQEENRVKKEASLHSNEKGFVYTRETHTSTGR